MTEQCGLFFSIDDAPRFGMALCTKETLAETIRKELWGGDLSDDDHKTIARWVEDLTETESIHFEDGWLALHVGIEAIAAELMRRCVEQYQEAGHADVECHKELVRREQAEARFNRLSEALRDALGDKGPEIAAKAA